MARVSRSRWRNAAIASLSGAMLVAFASGCVTVAEFRKLEARVVDLQRAESTDASRRELADSGADIDSLRGQLQQLSGRFEVSEKKANDALSEVRRLREELAAINARALAAVSEGEAGSADDAGEPEADEGPPSAEVVAYRQAYAFWRGDDHGTCIDEFRSFLQTYPASPYADDAAFWMADCHYKQGDYKNAVLRFDDVVRNYPTGNRAPDALYRQGESLLKLGPSYHEAAKRAFQRVLKEYPDSARAAQASDQLKLIEAG
jgi:tol-pal system protein YbgF